jgi:hypothetical protein
MLPKKDSEMWFLVFSISWLLNLAAIVMSRYQVNAMFDMPTTFVYVILSLLVASVTALGWFGLLEFTKTFIFFNFIGIINMLYITSTGFTSGWADITSLLNYIFFVAIGVIAGLLIQMFKFILDKDIKKAPVKKTVAKKTPAKKKTTKKKK